MKSSAQATASHRDNAVHEQQSNPRHRYCVHLIDLKKEGTAHPPRRSGIDPMGSARMEN
jgi:hypothetical protein